MILAGLGGIILIEIYAAVMQREFQNTNNRVGKGFAILGIYLFVVCYCTFSSQFLSMGQHVLIIIVDGMLNSTTWLYGAEVLPINMRSKVMGLAAASHFVVNVGSKFIFFSWDLISMFNSSKQSPKLVQVPLQTFTRTITTSLWRVRRSS